jgi:D-3-phosphoglycerate dehydrogenase
MKVIAYDPYLADKRALDLGVEKVELDALLERADIITLHVPETDQTKNLINKTVLKQFKKGSILLNYARGEVVDLDALAKALQDGSISGAAIDVYPWEPEKNGDRFTTPLQGLSNVILTPHIGGSTEEAQENIGEDVSHKLFQYLETGTTLGSHTIPPLSLTHQEGTHRILHIHKNVPGVLSEINSTLSRHNINILGQYLKTNDDIGYVVLDIDKRLSTQALQLLKEVKQTIKTRLLY